MNIEVDLYLLVITPIRLQGNKSLNILEPYLADYLLIQSNPKEQLNLKALFIYKRTLIFTALYISYAPTILKAVAILIRISRKRQVAIADTTQVIILCKLEEPQIRQEAALIIPTLLQSYKTSLDMLIASASVLIVLPLVLALIQILIITCPALLNSY